MSNLRQAAQQAHEALMIVYYADDPSTHEERAKVRAAITALRAALDEPERKPLTDDEIAQAMFRAHAIVTGPMQFRFAREIERAHGIRSRDV